MSDNVKLYRRIADSVADAIEAGQYRLGDRLPTERELAEQFGVSRPTLREAMIALEMLGMIEARHGLGIYVTGNVRPVAPSADIDFEIGAFELIEARRLFEGEAAALAATSISVETLNGTVQLSGFAKSQAERDRAESIARNTRHVREVRNSIVVRP